MDLTNPPAAGTPRRPSSAPSRRSRKPKGQRPPRWLMAALSLCLALVVMAFFLRPFAPEEGPGPAAKAAEDAGETETPSPSPTMLPSPPAPTPQADPPPEIVPVPEPTILIEPPSIAETVAPVLRESPGPEELSEPTEEGRTADEPATPADSGSWFSDAVFIGDSRVAGLRLYSGIPAEATFLDHTGLTIYEVKEGKKVIRRGDQKISILDALSGGSYGKVYIALGVNELGYFDPDGFAEACGQVVETIREKLPQARIYIQSLIPVNTAKCKANDIPYYITNEGISGYNEALADYFTDQEVYLLGIPECLVDENGEVYPDYSADGVHFKKEGYELWLDHLTAHTEG